MSCLNTNLFILLKIVPACNWFLPLCMLACLLCFSFLSCLHTHHACQAGISAYCIFCLMYRIYRHFLLLLTVPSVYYSCAISLPILPGLIELSLSKWELKMTLSNDCFENPHKVGWSLTKWWIGIEFFFNDRCPALLPVILSEYPRWKQIIWLPKMHGSRLSDYIRWKQIIWIPDVDADYRNT